MSVDGNTCTFPRPPSLFLALPLPLSLWDWRYDRVTVGSVLLWRYFSELGLEAPAGMKSPPKLEGGATDGSFANKHGRHVIGHIDDYSALTRQIGEGRLLVQKIASLARSAGAGPGLAAHGTEVITA